jgi:hypothetical protein
MRGSEEVRGECRFSARTGPRFHTIGGWRSKQTVDYCNLWVGLLRGLIMVAKGFYLI